MSDANRTKLKQDIAEHARRLAELITIEDGSIGYAATVAKHAQFITDWWTGKFADNYPPQG